MKKILWLPIDIPKFPLDNFSLKTDRHYMFWNFKRLTVENESSYTESMIEETIIQEYPLLIDWLKFFSFSKICNIKFNVQQDIVHPHVDFTRPSYNKDLYYNNALNDPCGFRVLISGSRTDKLYIINKQGKKYINLPNETDVYVLGQTNCIHGVDNELGRKSLYLHGYIDKIKHDNLIKKSWNKYQNYAVLTDT